MQKEILEKNPNSKLRVYAVWFNMLPTDSRSRWKWTGDVISDPRVVHIWDENKALGRWFAKHLGEKEGNIVWDAYFLYGDKAHWESDPAPLISSGSTINKSRDEMKKDILPLLKEELKQATTGAQSK